MLVDAKWIREKYYYFNDLLWDGELPSIEFKVNNTTKTWGYATYHFSTRDNSVKPEAITISNKYDSPENVKINILLHEMIHIADYAFHPEHFVFNHKEVRGYDAHGPIYFLREMKRINAVVVSMGYVVNPKVTAEEIASSKLNDRDAEKIKLKGEEGITCFIFKLAETSRKWGNIGYSLTHKNNYSEWLNYIKYNDWWNDTRIWTDEYISHKVELAAQKSNKAGCGHYIGESIDDFIKHNELVFVRHLQGTNNDMPKAEEPKKEEPKVVEPEVTVMPQQPEEDKKIKVFRFQTMQGNVIEFKDLTKDELRVKLKERFPKWSDEAIDRAINNPKYYPLKESAMKKIMNEEELKEYVSSLVQEELEQVGVNVTPVGQRRSKVKALGNGNFEQSIE